MQLGMDQPLRCFVPALVEERVEVEVQDEWLSESRKLVTVFMRILGLGERLCEVKSLATLQAAVEVTQVTTHRYGGQVTRLICDDKGVRFLVGFGMPGRSYEDDESRAVLFALQLQYHLGKLPDYRGRVGAEGGLAAAIGITTGVVFCGEAGSPKRREYTLAGARVNVAARLMQHAASTSTDASGTVCGAVLVAAEVQQAVGSRRGGTEVGLTCDFVEVEPIKLKGKEQKEACFRAIKIDATSHSGKSALHNELAEEGMAVNRQRKVLATAAAAAAFQQRNAQAGAPTAPASGARNAAAALASAAPSPAGPEDDRGGGQNERGSYGHPVGVRRARYTQLVGRMAELGRLRACLAEVLQPPPGEDGEGWRVVHADATAVASSAQGAAAASSGSTSTTSTTSTTTPGAALASRYHPFFVIGSTGMGKTALLETFLRDEARAASPFVLSASAVAVEATTPYHIWRGIYQRLLSPALIGELRRVSARERASGEPPSPADKAKQRTTELATRSTDGGAVYDASGGDGGVGVGVIGDGAPRWPWACKRFNGEAGAFGRPCPHDRGGDGGGTRGRLVTPVDG